MMSKHLPCSLADLPSRITASIQNNPLIAELIAERNFKQAMDNALRQEAEENEAIRISKMPMLWKPGYGDALWDEDNKQWLRPGYINSVIKEY